MNLSNLPKSAGIYAITNIKNGKKYVGSSKNIYQRIHRHFSMLRRNVHYTKHLQSAWNLYGKDAWTVDVLELCDIQILELREKHFIALFSTNNKEKGYNTSDPIRRMAGYRHSEETMVKMRKFIPRAIAAATAARRKEIRCIELNKVFRDAYVAAAELHLHRRNIARVCTGEYKHTGGYTFEYVKK